MIDVNNYLDVSFKETDFGVYDIDFSENGDFLMDKTLRTDIIVSLLTNKRANSSEISDPSKRDGWWGNKSNIDTNFEIGSKLWLLKQSRLTRRELNLCIAYAKEALEWVKTKNIADEINVDGFIDYKKRAIILTIVFIKNTNIISDEQIEYLFFDR